MKHKLFITLILLGMFLAAQLIGLFVINSYSSQQLPYGLQTPEEVESSQGLISIIFSFAIAIALFLILIKYRWKSVIRIWFFVVVAIAMAITLNSFLKTGLVYPSLAAIIISIPLAFMKIFRPNFIVHNLTELMVYPGIAAIFVPILNIWSVIILLILISIYDMWAVWKSGIMQKMAKFNMEELKIFGGILIPHASKKVRQQIERIKLKYKGKQIPKSALNKKFKVSLAVLGGGDIAFPLIGAGVFLIRFGLPSALLVTLGSFIGLGMLLIFSEKKKFYPAMPFITAGTFLGMLLAKFLVI